MEKFAFLQEILTEDGTLAQGIVHRPERIDDELLHLVHSPACLSAVRDGTLGQAGGTPSWFAVVARSAQADIFSGRWHVAHGRTGMADGLAGHLAGGTHHAFADHGAGYCLFNDLVVAAKAFCQ